MLQLNKVLYFHMNIEHFPFELVVGDHPEHAASLRPVTVSRSQRRKRRLGRRSRRKQKLL